MSTQSRVVAGLVLALVLVAAACEDDDVAKTSTTSAKSTTAIAEEIEPAGTTPPGCVTVTDIDGNSYNATQIGNQCWMAENLRVTTYPDGTAIPEVTDNTAWTELGRNNTDGAYAYYNNNAGGEVDTYGALYTFAAAIAVDGAHENAPGQGICPCGWHLPTDAELAALEDFVATDGHNSSPTAALRAATGWNNDGNGTNDYGFSALPSGSRSYVDGGFDDLGNAWNIWTATEVTSGSPCLLEGTPESLGERACGRHVPRGAPELIRYDFTKSGGMSVRCVRD